MAASSGKANVGIVLAARSSPNGCRTASLTGGQNGHPVEEVDVELEQRRTTIRVEVTEAEVSHRVARTLLGDLVAGGLRERLDLGEQLRAALSRLLGVGCPDEVEVDVNRKPRYVEMEQVERRPAPQRELVAEALADRSEQLRKPVDGLERTDPEAALACNAGEVTAVGGGIHPASRGAGRRCAGTITFQRLTSFPPRVPGSR